WLRPKALLKTGIRISLLAATKPQQKNTGNRTRNCDQRDRRVVTGLPGGSGRGAGEGGGGRTPGPAASGPCMARRASPRIAASLRKGRNACTGALTTLSNKSPGNCRRARVSL